VLTPVAPVASPAAATSAVAEPKRGGGAAAPSGPRK
jgi:hypothetical protein